MTVVKGIYGMEPKSRGKHPIKSCWAAATLYVSKNSGSGFFSRALGDLGLQQVSNTREAHVAEGIHFTTPRWQRTLQRNCSFGNDDNRRIVTRKSMFDEGAHLIDVEWAFGDQYCVCTSGDAGMPGDPTRVTSHDLDNEHTVVALRRSVQSIDGFRGNRHGSVKAERVVGGAQIVVDGLWHAHDRKANRGEFGRHAKSVFTPDDNKTFDTQATYRVEDPAFAVVISVGICSAGPEDRASPREDATDGGDIECHEVAFHGSPPPVPKAEELIAVDLDTLPYDSSDHRVQTRAITAPRQHSDPHGWERTQRNPVDALNRVGGRAIIRRWRTDLDLSM